MVFNFKKLNCVSLVLVSANTTFSILAVFGLFEGKDLLPILIAILSFIFFAIYLFSRRKKEISILWPLLVLVSGIALYICHFNIYLNERRNISRENSITTLKGNTVPTITYTQSINFDNALELTEVYKNNRFTIVNFWATWCSPCLKEMPILDKFHKNNKDKAIGLIGFTDYKSGDDIALVKIKKLVNDLDINYPILIDTTTQVRLSFKADLLPATVLIDQNGRVIDYQIGVDGAIKIMKSITEN